MTLDLMSLVQGALSAIGSVEGSALFNAQANNVSYVARGFMRVSGEQVGLPKAIPDDRKIDYLFRDVFLTAIMGLNSELGFRIADEAFMVPLFQKKLGLQQLDQLYRNNPIHTPTFLKGHTGTISTPYFPEVLRPKMLGYLVTERSFDLIPDLLEQKDVPELQKRLSNLRKTGQTAAATQVEKELLQTRVLAHHLRRIFNPHDYLQSLAKQGRLSSKELQKVSAHLTAIDQITKLYGQLDESQILKSALAKIQTRQVVTETQAKALKVAQNTGFNWFKRQAQTMLAPLQVIFKPLLFVTSKLLPKAAPSPFTVAEKQKLIAEAHQQALQKFHAEMKRLAKLPGVGQNSLIGRLARMSEEHIIRELRGYNYWGGDFTRLKTRIGSAAARKEFNRFPGIPVHDFLERMMKESYFPMLDKAHGKTSKISQLIKTMVSSKVAATHIQRIVKGGDLCIRLPLGILGCFLAYGLVGNFLDAKWVQPWEKGLVNRRGDAKDGELPALIAIAPAIAAYVGVGRLPFVKNLGPIGSFVTASLAGIAAYAGGWYALFSAFLKRYRPDAEAKLRMRAQNNLSFQSLRTVQQQLPQMASPNVRKATTFGDQPDSSKSITPKQPYLPISAFQGPSQPFRTSNGFYI